MGRILIADDHDALRRGLVRGLTEAATKSRRPRTATRPSSGCTTATSTSCSSDLKMGGSDGLDVLRHHAALHPTTAVILMTAFGSVNTAVEAMKIGAFDYVQKPFEIEEMEVKIEKALEVKALKHELDYLRGTQQDIYDFDKIVGSSAALQRVLDIVKKVAKSNTTC
jgi:DNA-binding NtrC family response regulator